MEIDHYPKLYTQPTLFDLDDSSSEALELIPKLWFAAEALSCPDEAKRVAGLSVIVEKNAARFSPMIAYLLFTRIGDPNPDIQKRVVETLANVLGPDENGLAAPEQVRINLYTHLSGMENSHIHKLLTIVSIYPDEEENVEILLKTCSQSGKYLADILLDRSQAMEIRELSANYIGKIGYLDALPVLERLVSKLETKYRGQKVMPFSNNDPKNEISLLPSIRNALKYLYAP